MLVSLLVSGAQGTVAETENMREATPLKEWTDAGLESLEWGLLLEGEGSYSKSAGESESDLVLATVEFRADAEFSEWLGAHLGLLWEEDDTEPMDMDEAFITVGDDFYARAGKFYLPFGNFESAFVSDPLTLELAEINQSSVMAGYAGDRLEISAGAFKGDGDSCVEDVYVAATFMPSESVQCGVYYLSDLMETCTQMELGIKGEAGYEKQGGAGAFFNLFLNEFMLNAEVVSALDEYRIGGAGVTPMAYSAEASMAVAERWVAGLKLEGSEDLYAGYGAGGFQEKYHGTGYGAVVSYAFHENAAVSAEYLRLEELDNDENGHLVTLQLAVEM